ncbi:MAG: Gfo/Idh/MocA family oxidoreductase [Planctomycetes bacterium]|nr:Gfo/Idh/MocA family oxidoreductase [Planctomycetota bacterium]
MAAAPYFVPRSALGKAPGRVPSERINLAIIGLKKMGGAHVRTLLNHGDVQIVAVCDVRRDLREATKLRVESHYAARRTDGKYRGCEAYHEYERVMARDDIDAVLIAVPDHWHAIIAIAACRAGKDVYCEKPLSRTIGEARQMVGAARRYATVFQTGSQQRSSGNFRRACELIRNGYIGEVKSVHVEVGPVSQPVYLPEEPIPDGFDYDRWLGPAPWAPYNKLRVGSHYHDGWRRIRDYSGGKMTDWGAHHFDIVQWGLGMDDSGPVEIIPPSPRQSLEPLPKIVDGTGVSPLDPSWGLKYRYANGIEVVKDHTNGLLFVGTEGKVEVNRGHLRTWPESLRTQRLSSNDLRLYRSPGHHTDWFDCIRTRRRPICDVEIGCRSATVCHLGNIALWLDRSIRWDPASEQIIGDETAARWLDRPKRAPYRL